jgi:cobalt/nickel transport system permease protein
VSASTLPDWYFSSVPDRALGQPRLRRRASRPVRRALATLGEALARELSTPVRNSWLARIEPRAKIVGIVALVVGATLLQKVWLLAVFFALALAAAVSVRLTASRLIRIWLGVPLFSLAIILPATLNLVTHGPAVLTLWHFAPGSRFGPWAWPEALTITQTGLIVAGRFVLRSLTCVTLVLALVATTDAAALLNALRRLGMPRVFGMVLTMSHRYLSILLRAAEEIHLAKLSRTITAGPRRREQRWVAAGMGLLFRRTYRLAQEVHEAMLSRGYDGDLQIKPGPGLRPADWVWLSAVALAIAGLALAERLT